MFLEKLEIQGFKSFANKNMLVFPGMLSGTKRGITAVVGPNGSGKSNVADAVRWALGEQSMKTLRGKKSEDVIFSGSDKKGKLGMAEVSLHLNNEDHTAKFEPSPAEVDADAPVHEDTTDEVKQPDPAVEKTPIDYSEIVITRRLYRNGDSEYIINNNRVRLFDIQMLLARAKFGQKTYSVIGQGIVEGFLNTSLSERKEFFDEATGVKQFQIKRDDSLSKLVSSHDNLTQAQMLLNEIEPRLKSLTRQVNKLKKRDELERELKGIELDYYSRLWRDIYGQFTSYNGKFLELEKVKFSKDKKLAGFGRDLDQLKLTSSRAKVFSEWQGELRQVMGEKEEIGKKLARLEAQLEVKLEASGQFDVSFLLQKKDALEKELLAIDEEVTSLSRNLSFDKEKGDELNREKAGVDASIEELNHKIKKISGPASGEDIKEIGRRLRLLIEKLEQAENEGDLDKIKALLKEIKEDIRIVHEMAGKYEGEGANGNHWQEAHEAMKELTGLKEAVIIKIGENNLRLTARGERVKLLKEKSEGLKAELNAIEKKLKEASGEYGLEEAKKQKEAFYNELKTAEEKIARLQGTLEEASAQEAKEKDRLFSLQQDMQNLQNEINGVTVELNELKINSTRFETKLEDLEIEIRGELGGLKEVRERAATVADTDEAVVAADKERISSLKRQLEQIGGIDPQIEKEYNETKERFDFLTGQVDDLRGAIVSLEKIIKELDLTIKERFDKEFKIIEKKFEEYFKILFNGGTAKIIKVMAATDELEDEVTPEGADAAAGGEEKKPDDSEMKKIKFLQKHNATGLAGIEIQATPPGKKIKSIAMLSGGERALTAIALICAIISANPSPFVVLDEVDAALDEANSERLAKILDELSHKTQFIVITHNRASMRRANILYGVTMGDDGVSKLLSVKLDEAAKAVEAGGQKEGKAK